MGQIRSDFFGWPASEARPFHLPLNLGLKADRKGKVDQMLRTFWRLVQPKARRRFVVLAVVVMLGGFVELLGIGTVAEMMALVASNGQSDLYGPIGMAFSALDVTAPDQRMRTGLLVSLAILAVVHGYSALRSYLRCHFVWFQDKEISTRGFSVTLQRPYSWFLTRNSSELQTTLLSGAVTQGLMGSVLAALGQLSVACILGVALIWLDPKVALVGLAVVGVAYGLVRMGTQKLLIEKGGQAYQADHQRRVVAQEALTSIRFVKTTGREGFFLKRFRAYSDASADGMIYNHIYVDVVRAFLEWVSFAGILGLSVFLLLKTQDFEQLLPRLTLYTMASYRIVPAIHELFGLWTRTKFDATRLRQVEELLEGPELGEAVVQETVSGLTEDGPLLRFENVKFSYESADRPILNGINLSVGRREWVGIVGSSGAGKTTMLDLMSGLCQPTDGRVVVGTSPLTPSVVVDWQRRLGVVPQEVILLDDSLLRNVAFGFEAQAIDEDRVKRVCQAAGLSRLIETLPEGYQTSLGDRGVRLSGGERQRVGLARALYLQPDLLLLDEATSALDQATEARIVSTLRELVKSCSLVTVAHRLSSVKPCDRILVLERGVVVAEGTFDELIKGSSHFQELALVGQ
jgi:ABC-type bacteriocin/lantibiotic exporter with double-glycine peptidase domain